METGELASNAALLELLANVKRTGGRLHFAGLLSDGGVHSHINHLGALMDIAAAHGVDVRVHAFMDGRDTSPTSGAGFLAQLGDMMARTPGGAFRRCRWNRLLSWGVFTLWTATSAGSRVKVAWDMMVHGEGQRASDPVAAVEALYAAGETDEFLKPQVFGDPADVCVRNGDGIFFINFRADRGRELVSAFHFPDFDGFDRGGVPALAGLVTMTSYDSSLHVPVAFPKENLVQTLGEVVADAGAHQLRIAETEKYAHVTYFFSGGREEPFPLEDRILVNSPKDVATYDLKPQMSVLEVTDRFLEAWAAGPEKDGVPYTLAVCNLANPDMVGHTGVIEAAVKALEYVDGCVARLVEVVLSSGGRVLMTADHGNVEVMLDETGHPQTAHTCNQVPLVVVERGADGERAVPVAFRRQAWGYCAHAAGFVGPCQAGRHERRKPCRRSAGMSLSSRPVQPVPPESMELVFFYRCPGCGRRNPLIAPTQPSMTRCESCGEPFPVMPVDERTVHYVKIMLANGRAALDPDFA